MSGIPSALLISGVWCQNPIPSKAPRPGIWLHLAMKVDQKAQTFGHAIVSFFQISLDFLSKLDLIKAKADICIQKSQRIFYWILINSKLFYIILFIFKILFRHTERGRHIEGEAGSPQKAQRGTQSLDPESGPEAKADAQPLSHPGVPKANYFRIECQ